MAENLDSTDVFLWDPEECYVRAIHKGLGRPSQGMRHLRVCHNRTLSKKKQPRIRRGRPMLKGQLAAVFIRICLSVPLIKKGLNPRLIFKAVPQFALRQSWGGWRMNNLLS